MNDNENKYVGFKITPYALAHVLNALYNCKIYNYVITLEDNDLVIRINVKELKNSVYKKKEPPTPCVCLKECEENE